MKGEGSAWEETRFLRLPTLTYLSLLYSISLCLLLLALPPTYTVIRFFFPTLCLVEVEVK